jgi:hypothetical protein
MSQCRCGDLSTPVAFQWAELKRPGSGIELHSILGCEEIKEGTAHDAWTRLWEAQIVLYNYHE